MHVDIMKTWGPANAVLHKFFPDLVPGVSWIVHQDFVHYNTVWIHLLMYRFREHFDTVHHIAGSTAVEFRLRSAIPPALLQREYGYSDFDAAERKAAFAWSRSLIDDPFLRFNIDAAEAMTPLHMGDREAAGRLLRPALAAEAAYKEQHPQERRRSELTRVEERLLPAMG